VVDVALRPFAIAVDRLEAVTGGVLEKCRVVVVGVTWTRPGRSVVGEPGDDAACPKLSTCARLGAMNATWTRRAIGCCWSVRVSAKLPQTEKLAVSAVCVISSSSSDAAKARVAAARSATRRR
jgi:hypothetical protein